MKTIKRAAGSKSAFLGKLALPFLLLIAVLGIKIGGGQTPPREPRPINLPDIGGQAVPRNYAANTTEIGGQNQQTPRDSNPLGIQIGGGQTVPRTVVFSEPIGGNQNKPQEPNPLGIEIGGQRVPGTTMPVAVEIGGSQTAPSHVNPLGLPIGGNSTPRSYAVLEPAGSQGAEPENGKPISFPNIGGNSCPRCGMSGVAIEIPPIGGTQIPPRPIDIGGGQLPPKSPLFISSFLTDCTVDIGGNQGVPQLPLPIGGNGGGSTAPRNVFPVIIGS